MGIMVHSLLLGDAGFRSSTVAAGKRTLKTQLEDGLHCKVVEAMQAPKFEWVTGASAILTTVKASETPFSRSRASLSRTCELSPQPTPDKVYDSLSREGPDVPTGLHSDLTYDVFSSSTRRLICRYPEQSPMHPKP